MSSKSKYWFSHVEAWRKSGLAQIEYARQHDLSIKSFSYYRRRYFREIEQTKSTSVKASLLPVEVISEEVQTTPYNKSPDMKLTTPNGFFIEFSGGINPHDLQQVLNIVVDL